MDRSLALLICTISVLFLLWIERKHTPKGSLALWIPTLWMLGITGKPLGRWFGVAGEDGTSPLDQFSQITLFSLGVLILVSRNFSWSRAIRENMSVWLLIGYMLLSIVWSDVQYISFKRWTRELIVVVMVFVVLSERDPRQAIQSLFRRTIYIFIPYSWLLIKYFPEYGRAYGHWSGDEMWVGVTTQKNALGRLCLIAVFFLVWTLVTRWQGRDTSAGKYQVYADLSVLTLALLLTSGPGGAYSATAVASLVAGLAALVGLSWLKKHKINLGAGTLSVIMVLVIGIGILQPFMGGSSMRGAASSLGRDMTLTGRTDIWAGLLPYAMENPIGGSGFESFWTPRTKDEHQIGEAHNGYLDVVLNLGFVGLLLIVMLIVSSCRKVQRILVHDYDWGTLEICFLLMVLTHNITESSINTFTNPLTAILLLLALSSTSIVSSITENPSVSPGNVNIQHSEMQPNVNS